MFIELSTKYGKFIGNVNLIQHVFVDKIGQNGEGKTCIVGWNGDGYIEVNESYEEVIQKINERTAKVTRL